MAFSHDYSLTAHHSHSQSTSAPTTSTAAPTQSHRLAQRSKAIRHRSSKTRVNSSVKANSNANTNSKPMSPTSWAVSPHQKMPKDRTVCVFDWDDTLCPSTWLHANNLLPKYHGQPIQIPSEEQQILNLIAQNVARLLEKAASYGPVFVVTAAEYGWVELSCALYMPSVQAILNLADIHIVSARSWYEQTFGEGGDSSCWKHEVMQLIASKCFAQVTVQQKKQEELECFFNFMSIGDSMAERDACHSAVDQVPFTFAKTLKFVEQPDVEEIVQQMELTHDSFEQMCGWTSSLDLRLKRDQLHELRCRSSTSESLGARSNWRRMVTS